MFYDENTITTLHLEISTLCNAACPMCSRNQNGGATNTAISLKCMSLDYIKSHFPIVFITQLKRLMLCGNFGDPILNPQAIEIIEYFKILNPDIKIEVHTNGGVGNSVFWSRLAQLVHFCRFGIDGLETTNSIYRRGVDWNTLIANVRCFISSGGTAEWAFLVFKHNSHEIELAQKLSQEMGFKKFIIKKTSRYYSSDGQISLKWPVQKRTGEIEYYLEPPDGDGDQNHLEDINNTFNSDFNHYQKTTKISCKVASEKSIYIDINGLVFPCCWLALDYVNKGNRKGTVKEFMFDNNVVSENLMISKNPIDEIIKSNFFLKIKNSWGLDKRIKKCSHVCGQNYDPFKTQFKQVVS